MFHFKFRIVLFIGLYVITAGWNLKMENSPYILFKEEWKAEDPIIPSLRTQITDTTSTLTNAQKSSLTDTLIAFEKRKGSQIAVLIVGSTGDWAIEEYAVKVFETWKLGRKGIDDGILIVVAIQDHKTRIEVGYGLEGTIPDAIAKRIIEEFMIPRFREGNYFQGISDGIDKLILKIDGEELPETNKTPTFLEVINENSEYIIPYSVLSIFAAILLMAGGIILFTIIVGIGLFFYLLAASKIAAICYVILFIAYIVFINKINEKMAKKILLEKDFVRFHRIRRGFFTFGKSQLLFLEQ
ncbi:PF04536 family protein [Leptospira weilii str. Ecochallenge]|uniref:PF04536 family protein n=1 Tax=Leptospira weilii str. Ecochallenge TaxID=1049986 RepID=N1U8S4_9LEPT|nr:PF04536 family protein [Leptospira weilii str. Ecochallenge]